MRGRVSSARTIRSDVIAETLPTEMLVIATIVRGNGSVVLAYRLQCHDLPCMSKPLNILSGCEFAKSVP
jgi:hypothetical protein